MSLLLLTLLALFIGVVILLLVMAMGWRVSPVAAIAVLTASLALTTGAFAQFGWDIFRPLTGDTRLYLADRWIRPILEDLDRQSPQTESGATVSADRVAELLGSGPMRELPSTLVEALKKYQVIAAAYNKAAEQLDAMVLKGLRNVRLQPFVKTYLEIQRRQQYSVMHPSDVVSPKRMEQFRAGIGNAADVFVGVETPTYWGSRGVRALVVAPGQRDAFLKAIDSLAEESSSSAQAKEFLKQKGNLLTSVADVKERLNEFLRR